MTMFLFGALVGGVGGKLLGDPIWAWMKATFKKP